MAELVCFKCLENGKRNVLQTIEIGVIHKSHKGICEKCLRDWYGDEDHYAVGGPMVAFVMDAFGGGDEE